MVGSKLSVLVDELSRLSLQRYPDLPASMYIEKLDPGELHVVVGFEVPDELKRLYCTAKLMTEPWQRILLSRPSAIADECGQYNEHARDYSPPMRVECGVRSPVIFGDKLIPFGYYDDSLYCIDMNPDPKSGGNLKQIVNVSLRKGLAKVVFSNLEAFLEDGLKKMKREIKREQRDQSKGAALPELSPEQKAEAEEMLRDPVAYVQKALSILPFAPHLSYATLPAVRIDVQERAGQLAVSNPQRTPLQRICVELLQLYTQNSEMSEYIEQTLPPMPLAKRQKVERALGLTLPMDLQELLDAHQRIGVPWDNVVAIGIEGDVAKRCKELRSIKMPADTWSLWPGVAAPEFGKGLLPLGGDGDPVIGYDLQPGEGGVIGQLVEVSFEEATCKVIASSLFEFLLRGLRSL